MKKIYLLNLFILFNLFSYSQSWAPLGAKWFHNLRLSTVNGYTKSEVVSDTDMVNGIQCSRISQIFYYADGFGPILTITRPEFYTYEDAGKIYVSRGGAFYMIQDWNAQPGDVVPFLWENLDFAHSTCDSIGYMTIDSTNTINLNGNTYKRQYVHYYDSLVSTYVINDAIIQHYGAMHYFFFYRSVCDSTSTIDVFEYDGISCYYEPHDGWTYFGGTTVNCDYFNSTEELSKENFFVYPNPTINSVRILFPGYHETTEMKIYDVAGKNIHIQSVKEPEIEVDLANFSPGYYYISLQTDKGVITQKLLKM